MPDDLEGAEQQFGVRVEAGDLLLVRTGNYRKIVEQGPVPSTVPMVACHVACTPWFKARDIAMLGTDTSNDAAERLPEHRHPVAYRVAGRTRFVAD